jgi:hypothetical protein
VGKGGGICGGFLTGRKIITLAEKKILYILIDTITCKDRMIIGNQLSFKYIPTRNNRNRKNLSLIY